MRGIDDGLIGQGQQLAVKRVVQHAPQVVGRPPERHPEVGPPDVADEQRIAGQDGLRLGRTAIEVVDDQRDRFGRVPGGLARLQPDRIAVYSYAHVPWLRPHQKMISISELPDAASKFELLAAAIDTFSAAGYVSIGMDHFARPGDDLAIAARERRLHRNFMGYTTRPASDLVAVGVSAISDVRGAYAQNTKKLTSYYAALDGGRFPIERGYALSADDLVRRFVIGELMCNFRLDREALAERFGIDFHTYFASELEELRAPGAPIADGLVQVDATGLQILPHGRPFVRTTCMAFDRYLVRHRGNAVFSRTI